MASAAVETKSNPTETPTPAPAPAVITLSREQVQKLGEMFINEMIEFAGFVLFSARGTQPKGPRDLRKLAQQEAVSAENIIMMESQQPGGNPK